MSAISAVQGRSAVPGRAGQPAQATGGEDFSAILAALGGVVAAAPLTPVAGQGEKPAGQGDPLRLAPASVPGAATEAATEEAALQLLDADAPGLPVPLRQVPAAAAPTAAPTAVPTASLAVETAPPLPAPPAVPASLPAAAAVPTAVTVPDVPALLADVPSELRPATDVPVPAEAADANAVEAEADLPDAAAPGQAPDEAPAPSTAPAAQPAAPGPADTSPDLPPVAAAAPPAPAAGAVTAAAAPVEAAPAPPPPAAQLLSGLGPVLEGPDGAHTMSLQLYPEELGAVQVEISLRNGEISLALRTPDVGTLELLRSAAADLRTQLESTGLTSTGVSVDLGHGQDDPADQGRSRRSTRSGDGQPADPDDEPATTLATSDSALDVRI